jgi:Mg2+-importing ATPase
MLFFGPISSIFDILTFCLMWFVFHANTRTPDAVPVRLVRGGLLSQTLIVHMIRTPHSVHPEPRRVAADCDDGIVMALGIALPFSPLASYLQLQALPLSYFPWLVAILAGYMVLTQMVKGFYAVGMGGSKNTLPLAYPYPAVPPREGKGPGAGFPPKFNNL